MSKCISSDAEHRRALDCHCARPTLVNLLAFFIRLVAGSNGAVELLASLSQVRPRRQPDSIRVVVHVSHLCAMQASETESVRLATTDALTVCLMSAENRDRLPEDAVRMLCTTLRDASLSAELHGATLDCVRLSCTKNELNRQKMVGEGLVPLVVPNLDTKRGTLVSRSCKLLRDWGQSC